MDQLLKDMADIRALIMRYTINGDRGKVDVLASCFASDGVLKYPGNQGTGPDGVFKALTSGAANPARTFIRHNITSSEVLMDDSGWTATGRTYFFVISDNGPDHSGVYVDKYRREDGQWKIAHRDVRIDWQAETSLYGPMVTR